MMGPAVVLHGMLLAAPLGTLPPADACGGRFAGRSLAFVGVTTQGYSDAVAALLAEALVTSLRRRACFGRIVSTADVREALTYDQQRQMMDCSYESCMVEISNALGVDFLLSGTLGQIKGGTVLNLKLVDARSSVGAASVSRMFEQDDERQMFAAAESVVEELLAPPGSVPAPLPAPGGGGPATDGKPEDDAGRGTGTGKVMPRLIRGVAAGSVLAGAAVALLFGLGGAVSAVAALMLLGAVATIPGAGKEYARLDALFRVFQGLALGSFPAFVLGSVVVVAGVIGLVLTWAF